MKKTNKQKTLSEVALAHGVYPSTITRLIQGKRKTARIDIAISVAQIAGKRPIDYMKEQDHKYLIAAHPSLGKAR